MMSQTSADVNANVNPVYADVIQVKLSELLASLMILRCLRVGGIGPFRISSEFLRIWLSPENAMDWLRL